MSIVESLPTYGVHYYAVKVRATKKVIYWIKLLLEREGERYK